MCDLTDQMITTNSALRIGQYKTSSENLLGTCRVPAGYRPKRPMPARLLNPAGASRGYIPDGHRRTVLDKVRLFAQARFWIVRTYPESCLRLICVLGYGEIIQNRARHLLRAYTYPSSDKDKRRTKIKHGQFWPPSVVVEQSTSFPNMFPGPRVTAWPSKSAHRPGMTNRRAGAGI
ncbi:hypothetical protein Bbelb_397430 [Branchiostoma belcheri]|nr:hypothetical protein Bbelb_397430 [Branchiostoma belcheri]